MNKNVALIDFHAAGHHPTYLRLYAEAISPECGKLLIISPDRRALHDTPAPYEYRPAPHLSFSRFWRFRGRAILQCIERFFRLRGILREYELQSGNKIDRVIFACLYDGEFRGSNIWGLFFNWEFSALYLHPIFDREGQPVFRSWMLLKNLKSLAVLDETLMGALAPMTGKPVLALPDVVDDSFEESELLTRLRCVSEGRPIVLLNGFLHPQKGVLDFIDLASKKEDDFCFALVGSIHLPDYKESDQEKILRWSQHARRAFFYPYRVLEESVLNGLIRDSSLVFACYRDWKFSSNAIGKAAAFNKPIMVSKGGLMASRVDSFRLGYCVEEGNIDEMRKILDRYPFRTDDSDCSGYLENHSRENFVRAVHEMLD